LRVYPDKGRGIAEREVLEFMMLDVRGLRRFTALLAAAVASGAFAQAKSVQIPAGTPLAVKLSKHVPMKVGEPLECSLTYPVYAQNQLAIPAGSVIRGSVVALNSDRSRRIHARLRGDFTPFHIPVVRFSELVWHGRANRRQRCN
jgi:hypothetical protein